MRAPVVLWSLLGACRGEPSVDSPPMTVHELVCGTEHDATPPCVGQLGYRLSEMPERIVKVVGIDDDRGRTRSLEITSTTSDDARWPRGRDLYIEPLSGPIKDERQLTFTTHGAKSTVFVLREFAPSRARIDAAGWQRVEVPAALRTRRLEFDHRNGLLSIGSNSPRLRCEEEGLLRVYERDLETDAVRSGSCRAIWTSVGVFTKCTTERDWQYVFRDGALMGIGAEVDVSAEYLVRQIERGRHCP